MKLSDAFSLFYITNVIPNIKVHSKKADIVYYIKSRPLESSMHGLISCIVYFFQVEYYYENALRTIRLQPLIEGMSVFSSLN